MASWSEIAADSPDFAARVRAAFEAGTSKTLATSRADGAPRISGTELRFDEAVGGTRVTLGMMAESRKLADVRRDPRVAIHSPTIEPPPGSLGGGDAKLSGVLVEFLDPASPIPDATFFELDVHEAVLTTVDQDARLLVIESWHPSRGYRRLTRA